MKSVVVEKDVYDSVLVGSKRQSLGLRENLKQSFLTVQPY